VRYPAKNGGPFKTWVHGEITSGEATAGVSEGITENSGGVVQQEGHIDEEEEELPQLGIRRAIILMVAVTALKVVTVIALIGSIDGLTNSGHLTKEFVGVILIPLVANVAGPSQLSFSLQLSQRDIGLFRTCKGGHGFHARQVNLELGPCGSVQHCEILFNRLI
jgi:hypothetical protein